MKKFRLGSWGPKISVLRSGIDLVAVKTHVRPSDFRNKDDTRPGEFIPSYEEFTYFYPRKLTTTEIDIILKHVPLVESTNKYVREICSKSSRATIRQELLDIELSPGGPPDADGITPGMERLIGMIKTRWRKAQVDPGTPVGIMATDATTQPTTQASLGSFHSAGTAKNVSNSIEAIVEIFNASKNRKREYCTVVFKDRLMSFEDVFRLRSRVVGVTIGMLVKDTEYYTIEQYTNEKEWWVMSYFAMTDKKPPEHSRRVLRLYFDPNLLYAYRVVLSEVVTKLESEWPKILVAIHSPTNLGVVDIFPDDRQVLDPVKELLRSGTTSETLGGESIYSLVFLSSVVIKKLDNILLKGVEGIKKLTPVAVTVWGIVARQLPMYSTAEIRGEDDPNVRNLMKRTWSLRLNQVRMKMTGMSEANVIRLLTIAGCGVGWVRVTGKGLLPLTSVEAVVSQTDAWTVYRVKGEDITVRRDAIGVVLPPAAMKQLKNKAGKPEIGKDGKPVMTCMLPGEYVNTLIETAKEKLAKRKQEEFQKARRYVSVEREEIIKASQFVYADTTGSNLRGLFRLREVDPNYTYSNNYHHMANELGIEASRKYFVKDMSDMIKMASADTDMRHIDLIAEFVFHLSEPHGVTYAGISKKSAGFLSNASFERPKESFIYAALIGKSEPFKTTSSNLYIGRMVGIGTGAFDLDVDTSMLEQQMEENPDFTVNVEELRRALNEADNLSYGVGSRSKITPTPDAEERGDIQKIYEDVVTPRLGSTAERREGEVPKTVTSGATSLPSRPPPIMIKEMRDAVEMLRHVIGISIDTKLEEKVTILPLKRGLKKKESPAPTREITVGGKVGLPTFVIPPLSTIKREPRVINTVKQLTLAEIISATQVYKLARVPLQE